VAGNPARGVDETNLASTCSRSSTARRIASSTSRGFASIFGEWERTGEARTAARTFHESLRFPMPSAPVQVVLKKRDSGNGFREAWSTLVDPSDIFIDRGAPPHLVRSSSS
jgi:hypothetical protein